MQKTIVGNWKMHGEPAMAHDLALAVADAADKLPAGIEVVVCPPAILISQVITSLIGSKVKVGGQDCHSQPSGAFTGDIGAPMLKAAGCSHVIVGHSERRLYHQESNEDVRQKAARAIESGLIPIICVGESEAERDSGQAMEAVGRQLVESIPGWGRSYSAGANLAPLPASPLMGEGKCHFLLAYEPVWAIGSGKTPSGDDIRQMHLHIRSVAALQLGLAPERISVLYGGSVKAANAREIIGVEGVSGVLVGGASVKAEEFCNIVASG